MRPRRLAAALTVALLAVAGCGGDGPAGDEQPRQPQAGAEAPEPLVDCRALTQDPPSSAEVPAGADHGDDLPALTLDCFTGGEPVALGDVSGPAIINLWASWCGPCRNELPVLQQYADRHAAHVHVLGVVTEDTRARAAWFADEAGIDFPGLYDPDGELRVSAGVAGLPATLFVVDGQVRYRHLGELDEPSLARYAAEHLGVPSP